MIDCVIAPEEVESLYELVDSLTRGDVSQVKTVLATVVAVLSAYQVFLMGVGWGKLRLPFLNVKAASFAHRATGDMIAVVTLLVAFMCLVYFEVGDGSLRWSRRKSGRAWTARSYGRKRNG